ncbi:MAG TPA: CPBP family intramembrane glutamic endopeptidase [Acidimicrobiales bacterium]|nr:CPBP family intramembrane glutamic endopeptidase [Acidimicrobiales bacterium]
MTKRRGGSTAVLDDDDFDDWAARWLCAKCGYGNIGRERCIQCGANAPADIRAKGGLHADVDPAGPVRSSVAGRRAGRTVAGVIALNLAVQLVLAGYVVASSMDLASAVKLSLVTGLIFYGATALWVMGRSASLGLRPVLGRDTALVGAGEGFVVGGGLALLLVAVLRLALGHPVLDPTSAVLAANGAVGPLILGFLLLAVAAPVVEELVFRGFLAEALRGRGRRVAVLVSAAAFSLAHLRLEQFRYYLFMGVVFGLVYWRRGLIGSICAHAAFNGMLLVVALAATHGPPVQVTAAGATITVPAAWVTASDVSSDDLVAVSPAGARVELAHADVGAPLPPAEVLAKRLSGGGLPLSPRIVLDYRTVVLVDLPAGRAVSVKATVDGHDGRMVMIPKGDRLWLASVVGDGGTGGDAFDAMLSSWRLP